MAPIRKPRKRPSSNKINEFIKDFPDLIYDGAKIKCLICKTSLMCWSKTHCQDHVGSTKHNNNKPDVDQEGFIHDLCVTTIVCNFPFNLLSNETFILLWKKYANPTLPSQTTLRRCIPIVRTQLEDKIKTELKNKKLWLCVDEKTDCKKNSIINIMVRKMEPHRPSPSILLASRRVKQCDAAKISEVILKTLEKFQLSNDQVLIFMTDGAATMRSLGHFLKKRCGNILHITCKIHTLHLVAEQIRKSYPEVDALIMSTKAVFLRSSKYIRDFHKLCPHIPEPPQSIRWGAWLQAAFYYNKYFEQIKNVILSFDPIESAPVAASQKQFQSAQIKTDLQAIHKNYSGLEGAITKLGNSSLSLQKSVQIVKDVHAQLCAVDDPKNKTVLIKFESVLNNDSDFNTLVRICEGTSTDMLNSFKDYFNYVNLTLLDVERSFSAYKHIFSSRRTRFSEITVETHLMLKIYNEVSPICQFMEKF